MSDGVVRLAKHRLDFGGGCKVMGILNVTPDSFSDGGRFVGIEQAVSHGVEMVEQGAEIIDVGAESTRPGSERVSAEEQIRRAIPVIEALADRVDVPISIDTFSSEVARRAIEAGASIINDITAMGDAGMIELLVEHELGVILMHMQGMPGTMQDSPSYVDVVREVLDYLVERAEYAEKAGVGRDKIFIDPGIGFGKTQEHNLLLLKHVGDFAASGYKVLMGTSRKGFIGKITGVEKASDRVMGTAATVALSAAGGASVVRVHDVGAMVEVVKMANAIANA